jgi:glycosyltransferase involved in cell wall biosynthesis
MTALEPRPPLSQSDDSPTNISVVVPTRNRPESVTRAVRSVLAQSLPPSEVVVVVDGPDPATVQALEDIRDPRVVVIALDDNGGPARARNIGVRRSTGDWVAFLDDDDEWLPGKLRAQACALSSSSDADHIVLATGVDWRGDSTSDSWPLRSPSPNEPVTDYLFIRRRPGESLLHTSTILLRREFALACPFPEHLRIHEDYDWFMNLEKAGAHFSIVPAPLVIYNAPSARTSLSANAQWATSLAWALSRRNDMSHRAFSDFCLTSVARLARSTGGFRALLAVFIVASTGRLTSFSVARFLAICFLTPATRRLIDVKARPRRLNAI